MIALKLDAHYRCQHGLSTRVACTDLYPFVP